VCKSCGGALTLPTDPRVASFVCPFCSAPQRVADYVSDRFERVNEMRAQISNLEARRRRGLMIVGVVFAAALLVAVAIGVLSKR
jgi:hypothetical protein